MSYVNRIFTWDFNKLREFFNTYVKGAIFSAIKTDGSAYDVSEHFPTGGPNSDGKFTLEYILSNANTLIPEAWRKGGMSIRFVQSIDNKYVQARLMADSFTTDVTQWQAVDDEPTAGSDNLISSGGVDGYLNGKTSDVTGYTKIDGDYIDDGSIGHTTLYWHSSPIKLKVRETVHIVKAIASTSRFLVQVDASGNFVAWLYYGNDLDISYKNEGASDIYISVAYSKNGAQYRELTTFTITSNGELSKLKDKDAELQNQITTINGKIDSEVANITGYSKYDGLINRNGDITGVGLGYNWHSSPIAVTKGQLITLKTAIRGTGTAIALTNENGNYYKPVVFADDKVQEEDNLYSCTYIVEQDGYIAMSYLSNAGTPRDLSLFTASVGGMEGVGTDSDLFSKGLLYMQEAATLNAENFDNPSLDNLYDAEDTANIRNARFEREKMIAEVANSTNDDILVQGTCGYYDDGNGNITHGTITWKIYRSGILYISGYGKFYDFIKGVSGCKNIASVNSYVQTLGEHFWYYGFVQPNANSIVPPFSTDKYKYDTDEVMVYNTKRYAPFGEDVNPLNNEPYGYAAPWYIYRTEVDWSYASPQEYNAKNPNGYRYNRVCIVEDTANGGITYVGDWAFYRVTAESLILPKYATRVGCWGVRYSPTLKTIVMGDLVTEIEDFGVSRHEVAKTIKLSSVLTTLGYGCMSDNDCVKRIILPNTVTTIGSYMFNGNNCLEHLGLGSITALPVYMCASCGNVERVEIPSGVTVIGDNAFNGNSNIKQLNFPSGLSTIGSAAFSRCSPKKMIVDSQYFIDNINLFGNDGWFPNLSSHFYLYVKNTLTITDKFNSLFDKIGTILSNYDIYIYKGYFEFLKYYAS